MRFSRLAASALCALFAVAGTAAAPAAAQEPTPPKPGPEHEVLKQDEGTWDAVIEIMPGSGIPNSKGVEVATMGCGGLCLITDFKGETMPGVAFHGHGVTTWDPAKKKYVGSWTDSMSQGLSISEGTWDAAAKKGTGSMEGPDMTGKIVKMRTVTEYKPDGTRVFTLHGPGPDGTEGIVMRMTYTRRK